MMHVLPDAARTGRSWKKFFGGLMAVLLLAPVPVFAAITFTAGNWTLSRTTFTAATDPFGGSGTETGSSTTTVSTLNFAFNASSYTNISGVVTLTAPGNVSGSRGADTIHGTTNGLANLFHITGGTIAIQFVAGTVNPVDQYTQTYTNQFSTDFTNQPASPNLGNNSRSLRVHITFTGASFTTFSTPWKLTLN